MERVVSEQADVEKYLAEVARRVDDFTLSREAAFAFYVAYGRYESAAKSLGWVQSKDRRADLKVCPKTVADAAQENFRELMNTNRMLSDAVAYFRSNPPRKQRWGDDGPIWAPVEYHSKELLHTLEELAQARNNLVHGGKGWEKDECLERDREVVEKGLIILSGVIFSAPALHARFFGRP